MLPWILGRRFVQKCVSVETLVSLEKLLSYFKIGDGTKKVVIKTVDPRCLFKNQRCGQERMLVLPSLHLASSLQSSMS